MEIGEAIFMKKARDLDVYWEDRKQIKQIFNKSPIKEPYIVGEENIIELSNNKFKKLTNNFFKERFERGEYGGWSGKYRKCIKYVNKDTGKEILVDPQGFDYCRYVAVKE